MIYEKENNIYSLFLFYLFRFIRKTELFPGAERMDVYVPFLKGKSVAVFANQTSLVHHTNLIDTLLKRGIKVVKIFGPEHGFRGDADAGEKIGNDIDKKTGIEIISLYGKHNKPTAEDLKGVDVMIFDIQDVGQGFILLFLHCNIIWKLHLKIQNRCLYLTGLIPMVFMLMGRCLIQNLKALLECNRFQLFMV